MVRFPDTQYPDLLGIDSVGDLAQTFGVAVDGLQDQLVHIGSQARPQRGLQLLATSGDGR